MAYFPNSTAGMKLDSQCSWCPIPDDAPCPIQIAQVRFNYDQVGNEDLRACLAMLVDDKGQCKMKPVLEKAEKIKNGFRYINLTKDQVRDFWR